MGKFLVLCVIENLFQLSMHRLKSFVLLLGALALSGCATIGTSNHAASLQSAMEANHQATLAVLQAFNDQTLPFQVQLSLRRDTFAKTDLYLIAPEDIDAWDKVLCGLDAYCTALANLTSGQSSTDLVAATESLAGDVKSLGTAVKSDTSTYATDAGTAVAALGSLLLQYKADTEARHIAQAADPSFQLIIKDLIGALGFEGDPPKPATHGALATYGDIYQVATEEKRAKTFKGDTITGFGAMTDPKQKLAAIQSFKEWLSTEQEHDRFVASVADLAEALHKTALAHAALANGSPEDLAKQFAELKAEVKNVTAIYKKLKG